MILRLQQYFARVKPVTIDGALFVLLAIFGYMEVFITQDDAYKYWNVYALYYTKFMVGMLLAAATALKGFRSTAYGKHIEEKQKEKETNEKINNSPYNG